VAGTRLAGFPLFCFRLAWRVGLVSGSQIRDSTCSECLLASWVVGWPVDDEESVWAGVSWLMPRVRVRDVLAALQCGLCGPDVPLRCSGVWAGVLEPPNPFWQPRRLVCLGALLGLKKAAAKSLSLSLSLFLYARWSRYKQCPRVKSMSESASAHAVTVCLFGLFVWTESASPFTPHLHSHFPSPCPSQCPPLDRPPGGAGYL
jgi:hypothetical protein